MVTDGREGFPEDVRKRTRRPHVQEGKVVGGHQLEQLVNREAHLRTAGVTGLKPAGGRVPSV